MSNKKDKKKPNSWMEALKEYNNIGHSGDWTKGNQGSWCIPRKGTQEYKALKNIHEYEIKRTPLKEEDQKVKQKLKDIGKWKKIKDGLGIGFYVAGKYKDMKDKVYKELYRHKLITSNYDAILK